MQKWRRAINDVIFGEAGWDGITGYSVYVPRFRNVKKKDGAFLRGYGFQGGGHRDGWERGITQSGFGSEFKKLLSRPGPWKFTFYGYGECLPRHENYLELDKEKLDAWGIPTLKIHCAWGENELALRKDMSISAAEMLAAAGAHDIEPFLGDDPPGFALHEMGTARMGHDAFLAARRTKRVCRGSPNQL